MKPNTNLLSPNEYFVPLLEIHEIEFSSRCNLACRYCPHPKMKRAKADMTQETFRQTMGHLQHLVDVGTQGEVSLTGIGEAILHPHFVSWLHVIRGILGPDRKLAMATNGVALTADIAAELAVAKVEVFVSTHRPEKAGPAVEMLKRAGCMIGTNTAFVDSAIDWAGQVKWYVSAQLSMCSYLQKRWGAVRQDGSINTCCMDAESLYPIGHVSDAIGTLRTAATPLCQGCHLAAPLEFRRDSAWPEGFVSYVNEQRKTTGVVAA
ncbi:MAG: hypothetical protein RL254_1015 [Planctomycetota bacterium]